MPEDLDPKDATETTRRHQEAVRAQLPLDDPADEELARRGLLAPPTSPKVLSEAGFPVWDLDTYRFLEDDCPATVNPSLWRQARLNAVAGLFEVADGFYQVRGLDLANVTFIAGEEGWIVIDPLTSTETARAALELASAHLGERPVHTVIYTHSHIDHFAGVHGVVSKEDVTAGRVQIIAPEGFLAAAVSENVIAGNVMKRRGSYMYGALLPRGPRGHVDAGLGKGVPALGTEGLLAPTVDITETGTELTIDGVRVVFQLTPDTEAPAEMNFHFPDRRILCMAENCTANLHNLYTLRGAPVRDALAWSRYIDEAIELFADDSDVVFASHHWPRWGSGDARDYLEKQRALYRYLHDQTMRLANQGLTMLEVAEEVQLPPSLADEFFARGYYGTVNHNAKGVYQRYLGWFDGNPANLHPLPPADAGPRYVELMGGSDEVVRKARQSFDRGEYRWVAQLLNHVVFAAPDHREARLLLANTLEQLGYQAESGPWRDFYLTAAQELRHGAPKQLPNVGAAGPELVAAMTVQMLLDLLAVRLRGPAADGLHLRIGLAVTDAQERWLLELKHATLRPVAGQASEEDATVTLTHGALAAFAQGLQSWGDLRDRDDVHVEGDAEALTRLEGLLDPFEFWFDIIEP